MIIGKLSRKRTLMLSLCVLSAALAVYTTLRIIEFAQLFDIFTDHAGISITQREVALGHSRSAPDTPIVPKITHQVFHNWYSNHNNTLAPEWQAARQTCLDLNSDWQHKVR